ncbi:MAG: peptidylprolyl isomerase [Phycisphaerales bacterium]|jgi:FKBP-type peptidyl-prolyl cis-trans isomerase|nr:peptidylprolyl isomerase [Phycisphaerales bacterium]
MLTALTSATLVAAVAMAVQDHPSDHPTKSDHPAKAKSKATSDYQYVEMDTSKGDMVIMLDRKAAPITVENFIAYAKDGGYDGTIFHRVIDGFMVQGGGFEPGLTKRPTQPQIKNEWRNGLKNKRGTIAMARLGGQPDSATNQFFINIKDNPQLDRKQRDGAAYAVFGKVVSGEDVVDAIKACQTGHAHGANGGHYDDVPTEDIVIKKVTLLTPEQAEAKAEGCRGSEAAWRATQQTARAAQQTAEAAVAEQNKKLEKLTMSVDEVLKNTAELPGVSIGDNVSSTSDSGLAWFDLEEGTGETPASPETTVRVHYTGYLTDGTKFDSSVDRGAPIDFSLSGVIPGWTEGVGSMKVGGKRKLVIPAALGYGARGTPGGPIPPNATLVFDVELLELP